MGVQGSEALVICQGVQFFKSAITQSSIIQSSIFKLYKKIMSFSTFTRYFLKILPNRGDFLLFGGKFFILLERKFKISYNIS